MFVQRVSGLARFAADKMGKSTIVQGEFLFAGLNSFEPGQEHGLSVCPLAMRLLLHPKSSIRFVILGRSAL